MKQKLKQDFIEAFEEENDVKQNIFAPYFEHYEDFISENIDNIFERVWLRIDTKDVIYENITMEEFLNHN